MPTVSVPQTQNASGASIQTSMFLNEIRQTKSNAKSNLKDVSSCTKQSSMRRNCTLLAIYSVFLCSDIIISCETSFISKLQSLYVNTVNDEWCQWGRWLQASYFYILKTFKRLILYLLRSQVHHAQDPLQFAYQANEDGGMPSPICTEHTHTW